MILWDRRDPECSLCARADELSRPSTPAVAAAQDAGSAKPLVLTPSANMDMHGRIAAANSQLNAFTASLTAESAAPTVAALLAAKVRWRLPHAPFLWRVAAACDRSYETHALQGISVLASLHKQGCLRCSAISAHVTACAGSRPEEAGCRWSNRLQGHEAQRRHAVPHRELPVCWYALQHGRRSLTLMHALPCCQNYQVLSLSAYERGEGRRMVQTSTSWSLLG